MPIEGVGDVVRLPRVRKIKLGVKKENDGIPYPSPVPPDNPPRTKGGDQ